MNLQFWSGFDPSPPTPAPPLLLNNVRNNCNIDMGIPLFHINNQIISELINNSLKTEEISSILDLK